MPVVASECRSRALKQLLPDLERLIRRGLPMGALADVFPIWLSGTVAQLSDTPSNVRIERQLFEEHPALPEAQGASLREQARTLQLVWRPEVERITPSSVWVASNAMNYVLVKSVAEILQEPALVRRYLDTASQRLGEELADLNAQRSAPGLAGDRRVSDAWAARLGFRGWYEWRPLDELPSHAPSAIEQLAVRCTAYDSAWSPLLLAVLRSTRTTRIPSDSAAGCEVAPRTPTSKAKRARSVPTEVLL